MIKILISSEYVVYSADDKIIELFIILNTVGSRKKDIRYCASFYAALSFDPSRRNKTWLLTIQNKLWLGKDVVSEQRAWLRKWFTRIAFTAFGRQSALVMVIAHNKMIWKLLPSHCKLIYLRRVQRERRLTMRFCIYHNTAFGSGNCRTNFVFFMAPLNFITKRIITRIRSPSVHHINALCGILNVGSIFGSCLLQDTFRFRKQRCFLV